MTPPAINRPIQLVIPLAFIALFLAGSAPAAGLGDRLSFHGVLAGATQRENAAGAFGGVYEGRASGPFQLEVGFVPHPSGEIFAKVGFAAGNGMNDFTCFTLASWAADQEADVTNINGRGRNHLLTAWYRQTIRLSDAGLLGVTAGIIDAADYVDQNAYANDEYTQFMNEALVNGPNSFAPSYDYGGAVELMLGAVSATAVVMEVGENDDGYTFRYLGTQLGYHVDSPMGAGNYRIILQGSDASFLDVAGEQLRRRAVVMLSFDQQLGSTLGAWTRLGWQSDRAAVTYADIYSGGIDINGRLWKRPMDNIGVGYGYLTGGNLELTSTNVFESYVRVALSEAFQITGDVQYMNDEMKVGGGQSGFIFSLRLTAMF